jgi:DNA polymerase I
MIAQTKSTDQQQVSANEEIELYVTNSAVFWTDDGHIGVRFYGWNTGGEQDYVELTGLPPELFIEKGDYEDRAQSLETHSKIANIDHGHESLFGDELTRLQFRSVGPRSEIEDQFETTYEADIWYTNFARIQLGLKTGIRVPSKRCHYSESEAIDLAGEHDPRVVTFDIENDDRQDFTIDDGRLQHRDSAILSIAAHDSLTDKTVVFFYTGGRSFESMFGMDSEPEGIDDLHEAGLSEEIDEVKARPKEKQMLTEFACWIQDIDPDLMTGWNFEGYDAPYLVARMEEVGVNPDRMARMEGEVNLSGGGWADVQDFGGRTVYDLMKAYKDTKRSELQSYRLNNVAREELEDTKIPHTDMGFHEMWKEDPVKFLNYNAKDTLLTVRINEEAGVLAFKNALREEVGVDFEQTRENNDFIEMFVRRKLHEKDLHGPTARHPDKEDFGGGHVFDPSNGVFENVTGIDVKSLYPMTMKMFNISPETKLTSEPPEGFPANKAPNGIWFSRQEDGIFRELIDDAIDLKEGYRTKRHEAGERGDREAVEMWGERYAVAKTVTNSIFGVLGWEHFFLYDKDVALAVTALGQACIKRSAQYVEDHTEGEVIYGDTDSNYIQWPEEWGMDRCIEEAEKVCHALNNQVYPDYANQRFGVPREDCEWLIEPENYLKRFFQSNKKKRYAYLCYWDEGDDISDDPELKITGYGSKRSDFSELTQETQKAVIKAILKGKDDATIGNIVKAAADEIHPGMDYSEWQRIGIPGGLGKKISREHADNDDYYNWSSSGDHPQDAHPRAAWNANHLLGTNIGQGSKPMRVYVDDLYCEEMDREIDVIGFETTEDLDNYDQTFDVNVGRMTEGAVIRPMKKVLAAVDIDVNAAVKGQMQSGLKAFM